MPIKRSRISGRSSVTAVRSLVLFWIMASAAPGSTVTWLRALLIVFCTSFCHCSSRAVFSLISLAAAAPSGGGSPALSPCRFRSPAAPTTGALLPALATTPAPAAGRGGRGAPLAFLAMASLIARAAVSLGLRLRASPASLSAAAALPPLRASRGQDLQTAAAGFNLLLRRGQTGAIDQRQRPATVDLRLVDQGHQVAVVAAGLQRGNVPGQLLRAGRTVHVDFHLLGRGRLRRAHQHRVAVAAQGRKGLRINVHAVGPLHVACQPWARGPSRERPGPGWLHRRRHPRWLVQARPGRPVREARTPSICSWIWGPTPKAITGTRWATRSLTTRSS